MEKITLSSHDRSRFNVALAVIAGACVAALQGLIFFANLYDFGEGLPGFIFFKEIMNSGPNFLLVPWVISAAFIFIVGAIWRLRSVIVGGLIGSCASLILVGIFALNALFVIFFVQPLYYMIIACLYIIFSSIYSKILRKYHNNKFFDRIIMLQIFLIVPFILMFLAIFVAVLLEASRALSPITTDLSYYYRLSGYVAGCTIVVGSIISFWQAHKVLKHRGN